MLKYSSQKPCWPASAGRPPRVVNPSLTTPPGLAAASTSVTSTLFLLSVHAVDRPAQPAPTTTTFLRGGVCSALMTGASHARMMR